MNLITPRLPSVVKMLALPTLLLLGASAQAKTPTPSVLNFTFNVTNTNGLAGYNIGQPYTFTFVVNGAFAVGSGNAFSTINNVWSQQIPTDQVLISNFTGSGIAGSAVIPASFLQLNNDNTGPGQDGVVIQFMGASGLTANGNSLSDAIGIVLGGSGNISDVFPGTYIAPQSVFSTIPTTPTTPGLIAFQLLTSAGSAIFDINSFSIDTGAAEVPFGVDSTVGLAALGLAGAWKLRRRRKLAAAQAAN